MLFNDIFKDKKVVVTGHTGFKGSWLSTWLIELGANVCGISKDIPTSPSLFQELELEEKLDHQFIDIRDEQKLSDMICSIEPDFLFHLAAQPIVSTSYIEPAETISTNVIGTMNVLEALRKTKKDCNAIIITSDKAYDNVEQVWGYKENDRMGGKDIYSGSKGAAELITKSYFNSYFSKNSNIKLAIGRAGNVIGGGDWAKDRIVVDCMLSWANKSKVKIRNPEATRPWQHVLEPISGYLLLAESLSNSSSIHGEAYNFGPRAEQNRNVLELIHDLSWYWGFKDPEQSYIIDRTKTFDEAALLKLNCDKALAEINWQANLIYENTIEFTGEWYSNFYNSDVNSYSETVKQINTYTDIAKKNNAPWIS
jgi:CDP-glucose 4,6-dehydratase